MKKLVLANILLFTLIHCGEPTAQKERTPPDDTSNKKNKSVIKPPSIFSDTLTINSKAAIFYYPDSVQLEKIKTETDTAIFYATMHEFNSQLNYVHNVLKEYGRPIKIIEARKVRYLLFIKADKNSEIIDLDTKYDPYGLIVFDPKKNPTQLEMTNAASEIYFYFPLNEPLKQKK